MTLDQKTYDKRNSESKHFTPNGSSSKIGPGGTSSQFLNSQRSIERIRNRLIASKKVDKVYANPSIFQVKRKTVGNSAMSVTQDLMGMNYIAVPFTTSVSTLSPQAKVTKPYFGTSTDFNQS